MRSLDAAIDDYLTYLRVERGLAPATIRAYRARPARLRGVARREPGLGRIPGCGRRLPRGADPSRPTERSRARAQQPATPGGRAQGLLPVRLRRRTDPHRRGRAPGPAEAIPPPARDPDSRRDRPPARGRRRRRSRGPRRAECRPRPPGSGAARAALRGGSPDQRGDRSRPRGPVGRRSLRPRHRQGRQGAARAGRRRRAGLARPVGRRAPARSCSRGITSPRSAAAPCSWEIEAGVSPASRPGPRSSARPARPASPTASAHTRSVIRSRPTCSRAGPTCASSRSCSVMRVSPPRSCTRISPANGSATSTAGPIRGPEREAPPL